MGFLTIPDNFVATLTDYTSTIFDDVKPIFLLLVGLFVGVYLIKIVLEIVGHKKIILSDDEEIYDDEE